MIAIWLHIGFVVSQKEIIKCPDGYVCGEAPFYEFPHPPNFCEERDWQPFWVNATKAWKKDNVDSTAKKAVIL